MNPSLKLSLYVVTAVGTLVFGLLFVQSWRRLNTDATAGAPAASVAPTAVDNSVGDGPNEPTVETNTLSGATVEAAESEPADSEESTNEVARVATDREAPVEIARPALSGTGWARLLLWGFLGFASVAGLGSLIAYDVTQYAGNRATESLFDDEGEGIPDSIDDKVDKVHGAGDFLGAIRLLREHLGVNPKAYEAQIRIAEIYEKDLNNPLAAALEYEELLKSRLPLEKRGWTSIHLVNLYNRLEKPDQAIACLQRVVVECPGTAAANKARERLEAAGLEVPEPPKDTPDSPDEPPSNLPPGFRPKNS